MKSFKVLKLRRKWSFISGAVIPGHMNIVVLKRPVVSVKLEEFSYSSSC